RRDRGRAGRRAGPPRRADGAARDLPPAGRAPADRRPPGGVMTGFETIARARSLPAPIGYHRALVRPLRTFAARRRALAVAIPTPLLQLHGPQDGCIAPVSEDLDRRWLA